MNRAAVLIGVNRVRGLPALNDAVRGTHRMNDWVLSQGFAPAHVALITDEGGPVTVAAVQDAIERLLDPMAGVEQLLIYFAGHGLNINYGEFWLMNRGLERPTESVDVARSAAPATRERASCHINFGRLPDGRGRSAAAVHYRIADLPRSGGGNRRKGGGPVLCLYAGQSGTRGPSSGRC
ncbi:MAG: caspase family protein [Chitinophagaceae bacterium]|nr:caspase family protein [Chitinophagaceae bacterium]